MKLKKAPVDLDGNDGNIHILRNSHGIPEITASTVADLMRGLGWIHANDRQMQTLLTRILLQGRAAELLKADEGLIEIDTYMRRMNFLPDPQEQIARLEPGTRRALDAYVSGFNDWMEDNGPVFEFKLMGYQPPGTLRGGGLSAAGQGFRFFRPGRHPGQYGKISGGDDPERAAGREIEGTVPLSHRSHRHRLDRPGCALPPPGAGGGRVAQPAPPLQCLQQLGRSRPPHPFRLSNICSDPHLEVNRLPNVWQEVILRLPGNTMMGVSIPGVPGLIIGRSNHLAWSATYAYMDMLDYRIERCRNGKYYRKDGWKPFRIREEEIKVKNKPSIRIKIHENENGLLEGDPHKEGHYLVMGWSGAKGCGAEILTR